MVGLPRPCSRLASVAFATSARAARVANDIRRAVRSRCRLAAMTSPTSANARSEASSAMPVNYTNSLIRWYAGPVAALGG